MMTPIFVVFDVTVVPSGDLVPWKRGRCNKSPEAIVVEKRAAKQRRSMRRNHGSRGLAIGGTDEYLESSVSLRPEAFEGKRVSLLRGGERVETRALGLAVHTALTDKRNVYLRIPNIVASVDSLRGAIVSVELDEPASR